MEKGEGGARESCPRCRPPLGSKGVKGWLDWAPGLQGLRSYTRRPVSTFRLLVVSPPRPHQLPAQTMHSPFSLAPLIRPEVLGTEQITATLLHGACELVLVRDGGLTSISPSRPHRLGHRARDAARV